MSKKPISILPFLVFFLLSVKAQEFSPFINKDSLFHAVLQKMPLFQRAEFQQLYDTASGQTRDFILFVAYMPRSSKKEMILNIDTNYNQISKLKSEYKSLVPLGFTIRIELNPEDKAIQTPESWDLAITQKKGNEELYDQDWNLRAHSEKLDQMLDKLHWNYATLATIKQLLLSAHCISIENGEITTIGYDRSGMGKYFYKLFDNDLTADVVKRYNDGLNYIFYKKNIVLEYQGGAIGSNTFPD